MVTWIDSVNFDFAEIQCADFHGHVRCCVRVRVLVRVLFLHHELRLDD